MKYDFITGIKLFVNAPGDKNLAYGKVTIADALDLPFYIKKSGSNKIFVSFIRIKKEDGSYVGTVFPKNRDISDYINRVIIGAYESKLSGGVTHEEKEDDGMRSIDQVPDTKGIPSKQTNKKTFSI